MDWLLVLFPDLPIAGSCAQWDQATASAMEVQLALYANQPHTRLHMSRHFTKNVLTLEDRKESVCSCCMLAVHYFQMQVCAHEHESRSLL